jgi:chaperonin GroES
MEEGLKVIDKRKFNAKGVAKPKSKVSAPEAPSVKAVPLGSKVLVWRVPEAEGLIAVAEVAQEKPLECKVVAVSETGLNEYDTKALALLQPGDKVLVRKNSGTEIKIEGHELTVLHVMDVLLKL